MIEAFPLQWPPGKPRTPSHKVEKSQFKPGSRPVEVANIMAEIRRLGGKNVVVSTNLRLRGDGLPYARDRAPTDQGVAVYFNYGSGQKCFACDRWSTIEQNLRAIFKSIEAIRGLERWGSKDFVDAAFTGFAALPSPNARRSWREVFGFDESVQPTHDVITIRYRELAQQRHPDRGGSEAMMAELNGARDDANLEAQHG